MSGKMPNSADVMQMKQYQQQIEEQLSKAGQAIDQAIYSNNMDQVKEAKKVIEFAQNQIQQAQQIVDSKNLM
ncbi:hypothetical protein SAMN00017405_2234 [Desulfonispora thiosulfatigenes DSM 11270]|uniref:Uncharacterized protein n=1 Tax=Desulfonispora thiosulfatigenes DSM 11270 TaxID=656914 RepID=A0A1W1VEG5_DESTI|nr:hypothetical protein [Desulfonispora thiosulfatigenes]SMB91706.1 hypothetical protein SAMN00017405_2234 [Desulfonispora thiosulfatigenes DSM 11270]